MKPIIVLVSAASGYGHIRAGEALAEYLREFHSDVEVYHRNLCDFAHPAEKWLIEKGWEIFSICPGLRSIYSIFHRNVTGSDILSVLFSKLYVRIGRKLADEYKGKNVKAVVALHPSGVMAAVHWKKKQRFILNVVATDYLVHGMQSLEEVNYIFADDRAIMTSPRAKKVRESSRFITAGIPIYTKKNVRHFNRALNENLKLVVSFGAMGLKYRVGTDRVLSIIRGMDHVEVDFICGFNKKYREYLRKVCKTELESGKIKVHGFRKDIEEIYKKSDVFVGKAGGLSLGEALSYNLPILIVECLPGQEETNLAALVASRQGIDCRNYNELEKNILEFREKKMTTENIGMYNRGRDRDNMIEKICSHILNEVLTGKQVMESRGKAQAERNQLGVSSITRFNRIR